MLSVDNQHESLFSFPDPVNEVSARLVAAGVVIVSALTIALNLPWMTALIAYGFLARVAIRCSGCASAAGCSRC
jgi:hypothetical protein